MTAIRPLPVPVAAAPVLFGETATSALLPWAWAVERLTAARNYWVVAVRPDGRPHSRPLWCVWLEDGLWFTTGSQAVRSLRANPQVSVNLEDGSEVLILEGVAEEVTVSTDLERFVAAYNAKYSHTARVDGENIADAEGPIGPAFRVRPRVVYGWQAEMHDPTRWTFPPDAPA
ncbi:MAG: pyridoxamine 5'-phosphate oxidase family protein [Chloroflexota bacterium]